MEKEKKDNSNDKELDNNLKAEENIKKDNTNKNEKKKIGTKTILVFLVIILFAISTAISLRAQYLNIIEINPEYTDVFYKKIQNKYIIFGVAAITIYLFTYILNKFTKRGLKRFFEEEKKEMPKLPNKSLSIVLAILGGAIASSMLADKFSVFINAAVFGKTDPIFGADIGYYMFSLPFIQSLLIFIIEVLVVEIIYTALYYVITLNVYFDGVSADTLKRNLFVKQELFIVVLITIVFCTYIFVGSQNILTGTMVSVGDEITTEITGAGKTDVTIKLWGYRILSIVIALAVLRLIKYLKKQNFNQ